MPLCHFSVVEVLEEKRGSRCTTNRLTIQASGEIRKNFEETGSATDILRSEHDRFACSASNVATVGECVVEDPNVSIFEFLRLLLYTLNSM